MLSSDLPAQSFGIQLSDVLPQARPVGAGDICFKACATRAESVRPGDLYIAVDTDDFDGHQDVLVAIERGATGVVTERFLPIAAPQFLVEDTRAALALIGHALAGHPSRQTQLVTILDGAHAVTPTVLISSVLERAGIVTGLANELGSCDGYVTHTQSTPIASPLAFARWLAECHANQASHTVVGLTPAGLASKALEGTRFSQLVLTGLRPDRGVGHANPRRAAQQLLKQLDPQGLLIYNRDDLLCREIAAASQVSSLSFGLGGDADVRGEIVERHRGEQTLLMDGLGDFLALQTKPFGQRFASFCLAAAAAGLAMGVDLSVIGNALEQVDRLPLSLEPQWGGQAFSIYLEQAWDPWSIRQCLKALKGTYSGKLIVVVSASSGLRREECAILGRTLEVAGCLAVITSDPHEEPSKRSSLMHRVIDGFQRSESALLSPDRGRAVRRALDLAGPDDVVLITGCRGEVGDQSTRESDRNVVEHWFRRGPQKNSSSITTTS